jgi:hypothetical protein
MLSSMAPAEAEMPRCRLEGARLLGDVARDAAVDGR